MKEEKGIDFPRLSELAEMNLSAEGWNGY